MSDFWVVVADATKARFFRGSSPNTPLEEFHDLVNEEGRGDEHDLVTDKEGRFHDDQGGTRKGSPRSSTEPSAKEHSVDEFAKSIADFLDRKSSQNAFEHLSILAEPKVLGRLRKTVASHTREKILEEVTKNLTKADEETIREHLERLPSGFK